ncbi:hypothetical protein CW705_03560 [Candidatus Bathyarchaeota archaeon]|nr:MAG: hypothetical protein CW705_03560 [Candidatus Bathyarchaeota archaeon]
MLIKEIILENFMSYEYARIPLKPGVNIICGPNGAGKSSILVGISVALGQSYTERSKRLSDLIRRGKDIGRVTLVLDNSRRGGRRPVRRINKDQIYLTRVLRKDGKYWFEIDNAHATKADVVRLLSHFNVDPDNMLIIMHQDMAEQFVVLSPQEKLRLVEAATGLESYRRNVLEARKKLSRILSQENSLKKMLESAEQTLRYWREQYDRYQQKQQLLMKRRFLERELAWAEVARMEEELSNVQKRLSSRRSSLKRIVEEIKLSEEELRNLYDDLKEAKSEWQRFFEERLHLEREKAKHEFNLQTASKVSSDMEVLVESGRQRIEEFLEITRSIEENFRGLGSEAVGDQTSRILSTAEEMNDWSQMLVSRIKRLRESVKESDQKIAVLEAQLSNVKDRMQKTSEMIEGINSRILEKRIDLAILQYRQKETETEILEIERALKTSESKVAEAMRRAEERGPRVATLRSPEEILDEIRVVDGYIAAMADIPGNVERMYESYSKLYLELQEKARLTAENREKALAEIERRMIAWRRLIRDLLSSVSSQYQKILSQAAGTGYVSLINDHDIEAAGIEIHVGFKGAKPVPLNIYSQSGGERSTAVMAFLLALQQHIQSPFRAIDEYDVHMDPRNREVIANLLISAVKEGDVQYLAITPNQMYFEGKDVHMITVQNIEGTSTIMEVT